MNVMKLGTALEFTPYNTQIPRPALSRLCQKNTQMHHCHANGVYKSCAEVKIRRERHLMLSVESQYNRTRYAKAKNTTSRHFSGRD